MITRGAADNGRETRGAQIERMGGSPLFAAFAPISGAVEVFVSEVKTVGAKP